MKDWHIGLLVGIPLGAAVAFLLYLTVGQLGTLPLALTAIAIAALWWGYELWRWFDLARRRRRYGGMTEEDWEEWSHRLED